MLLDGQHGISTMSKTNYLSEYTVVTNQSSDLLSREVNALLHLGWELWGGLQMLGMDGHIYFNQAMIRRVRGDG